MKGYSTQEVARLLDLPVHRIRSYARAGFVTPARGSHNEYLFSFQDLVLLRTAAALSRARVPARRISASLSQLQAQLPRGRSLSEVHIRASGDEVVVSESGEPPWNPQSGQFHIEFDVGELAARAAPLARLAAQRAHETSAEHSALEWFEAGVELEPVAPAEARLAYERAVTLDPHLLDAHVNLGRLQHEAGLHAEAEAQYRNVLADCEHALAAYNLGVLLEDSGRAPDAIAAYERALAADATLAEAHYNLARLYEARGDSRAAIQHFNGYRTLMRARGE